MAFDILVLSAPPALEVFIPSSKKHDAGPHPSLVETWDAGLTVGGVSSSLWPQVWVHSVLVGSGEKPCGGTIMSPRRMLEIPPEATRPVQGMALALPWDFHQPL